MVLDWEDAWSGEPKNGHTTHLLLSFPADLSPKKALRIAEDWAFEMFQSGTHVDDQWSYVAALHTDRDHPWAAGTPIAQDVLIRDLADAPAATDLDAETPSDGLRRRDTAIAAGWTKRSQAQVSRGFSGGWSYDVKVSGATGTSAPLRTRIAPRGNDSTPTASSRRAGRSRRASARSTQ